MWPKAHSSKERVRPSQIPACNLSHPGLFTSPTLNSCPGNIRSWFLLRLSNSPALLAEGFLSEPLACSSPRTDCQCSSCILLVQSLITPWQSLQIFDVEAEVLLVEERSLRWIGDKQHSFPVKLLNLFPRYRCS